LRGLALAYFHWPPPSITRIDADAIPLSCTVELETGLASREVEDKFERWLLLRAAELAGEFVVP
jgi:hypothetical protein